MSIQTVIFVGRVTLLSLPQRSVAGVTIGIGYFPTITRILQSLRSEYHQRARFASPRPQYLGGSALVLLWFGQSEAAMLFMLVMSTYWYLIIATDTRVRAIGPSLSAPPPAWDPAIGAPESTWSAGLCYHAF